MQDRKSYIYLLCISKIGGRIRPGKRLKKVRPAVVTEVKVFLQKKKKNEKGFLYLKTSKKEPSWGGLYWCALKKNLSATLQLIGARQKDPIYSRIRETSHRYKPSKGYRKYYLKKFLLLLLSATQEVNANRPEMAWISRGMHRYTTHLAIIILCPFFLLFLMVASSGWEVSSHTEEKCWSYPPSGEKREAKLTIMDDMRQSFICKCILKFNVSIKMWMRTNDLKLFRIQAVFGKEKKRIFRIQS